MDPRSPRLSLDMAPHCVDWLRAGPSFMLKPYDKEELEEKRKEVLRRRDVAIVACSVEIFVSAASMGLYDIRRSVLVPIANTVLAVLACVGLWGALSLQLCRIQAHGVVTTGLLVAVLSNFLCEALLSHAGLGSDTLPGWLVLIFLFVPYSLNLLCSIMSLLLGKELAEFEELEEESGGLLSDEGLAAQAQQLSGQDLCCVCMDKRKDTVITPCGHRAVCFTCAGELKARSRKCPVCRSAIGGVVRVFDS
ncbi:unnamed protein product [Effrenium voratum]|nr:unnamed protein product [Effrenium voratum]